MSDNELAIGIFCPVCFTRLTDVGNTPKPCPFAPHEEDGAA